eukprot:TRINITY_DN16252_c0_g1_i1.p1 TRINITY_DN16252_c0_g1~~TRINITY_DN16252_c0_g1_i1.p1  ORF type:complete len:460 (+),score=40.96 TRINITY_DN16252_c0_g1_i1:266-1645(+)
MAATRDQSSRVGLWLFAIVSIVPADLVLRRFLWPATVVLHVAVALQLALALPLELLGYSVSRYFGKWLGVPVNCAGLVTVAATMLYVRPIALRANGMLKLQRSLRSGHSQWSGPATDECSHIDHSSNPLIEVPHWEWIVADPTIHVSEDGLWSLFAASLFGIHRYVSEDHGSEWTFKETVVHSNGGSWQSAVRPFVYEDKAGMVHLYYEHVNFSLHRFQQVSSIRSSRIPAECLTLLGLGRAGCSWADGPVSLDTSSPYEPWESINSRTVGNPYVFHDGSRYVLYFSTSQVWLPDTLNYEPMYIGRATANSLDGPWTKDKVPVMGPISDDPWQNLGVGSLKLIDYEGNARENGTRRGTDSPRFVGLANGIYIFQNGSTGSAIRKWTSDDGVTWQVACSGQPLIGPSGEAAAWDASYVFGFDTVRISELEVIVYYNARDGFFRGFERIGASRITIPLRKE